jgi:hypothetical protein
MVVSDYQSLPQSPVTCNDKQIESHVWAPAYLLRATVVPNVIAAKQISYYCAYFKIDYPLPKEDHIYIPQFAAGAMENWGLITYAETALLWDPAINNVAQLQRVAVVIAHELAHQWFGNLVRQADRSVAPPLAVSAVENCSHLVLASVSSSSGHCCLVVSDLAQRGIRNVSQQTASTAPYLSTFAHLAAGVLLAAAGMLSTLVPT